VSERIKDLHGVLSKGEIKGLDLHRLMQILITRLEVDLQTKELHLDVGLPKWVVEEPDRLIDTNVNNVTALCLEESSRRMSSFQTQRPEPVILAKFVCEGQKRMTGTCFTCNRIPVVKVGKAEIPNRDAQAA
jgi:hypothetical protein